MTAGDDGGNRRNNEDNVTENGNEDGDKNSILIGGSVPASQMQRTSVG
jgi:hypothetical protein